MVRALKKSGLNIASASKLAPKLHVIVSEYVRQILQKRRSAKRANVENAEIKVENKCWGLHFVNILLLLDYESANCSLCLQLVNSVILVV